MAKKKYFPGMKLGPKNILFIEEISLGNSSTGKRKQGRFKCPQCGNTDWITCLYDVVQGKATQCLECRKIQDVSRCIKYNEEHSHIGDIVNNCKVINTTHRYSGTHQYLEWKCLSCHKIFERDYSKQLKSCGCPYCENRSKGEIKVSNILDNLCVPYKTEYKFSDCISSKNYPLRFDFYLPQHNCCIEYDGEQHFKEISFGRDDLQERQERDSIKDQYCKQNNIKLIRIPYWDYDKINEQYILSLL